MHEFYHFNIERKFMDNQKFEELAKLYPDLLQKAQISDFGVDNGWYNILGVLCEKISYRVDRARMYMRYEIEKNNTDLSKFELEVEQAIEELPTIVQVKEKFGTLRFYVDNASDEIRNYISFAESLSAHTCEICGSPGTIRNTGWIKVLCDKHHTEREEESKNNQEWYDDIDDYFGS